MKRFLLLTILQLILLPPIYAGRSFNGSSDLIVVPASGNALDISSGPMTISFWMFPTTIPATADHYPVSNFGSGLAGQFAIGFGACNQVCSPLGVLGFLIGQGGPITGIFGSCGTYTANKWYQVILYVDTVGGHAGQIVSGGTSCTQAVTFTEQRTAGTNHFNIGGIAGVADFQGTVAEVTVWNSLLTSSQMTALQTVCPVGSSARRMSLPNPVGYFPLYGSASPEPDLSGNKFNGVLTGTAVANHPPCTP
jgi:hypothetical protein